MAVTRPIQFFRKADAPGLMQSGAMTMAPMTDEQKAGMKTMVEAGYMDGDEVKILVDIPGFSLAHAWLKKDYPLLLHSHDSDCLYYVIAGSLQMGTESLEAGDSFFVPGGAAYTYRPGPDGVEVLEFRHQGKFDFQNYTKNPSFYAKAAATIAANRDSWRNASPPSETIKRLSSELMIDRFYDALARGELVAARACCTPDAVFWHNFDQAPVALTDAAAGWEALATNFSDLVFTDVRRHPIPQGFVQQHVMAARTKSGSSIAWPICVFVTLRDGLIARIDEYIDRAGSFPPSEGEVVTPGLLGAPVGVMSSAENP